MDYHQQPNFLLMTHPFSQWSMMLHNLSMNQMMILRKFQIGPNNGKCPLILINLNKLKKSYFTIKLRE